MPSIFCPNPRQRKYVQLHDGQKNEQRMKSLSLNNRSIAYKSLSSQMATLMLAEISEGLQNARWFNL
jgi:hypothetical protein